MIGTARQREAELSALYPVWEEDTQWTWFEKNSSRFSERIFLVDEERSYTYQAFLRLVKQVSAGLYVCGLRPGMMIAVDMTNRKELIAAVFALSRLSCTAVLINAKISDAEREYVISKSEANVLITDKPYGPSQKPQAQIRQILVMEDGSRKPERGILWEEMLALAPKAEEQTLNQLEKEYHDPERTSTIMFTSGSTSRPKGVMITDNMFLRSAFATANTRHMEIGRRIYVPIPLFHAMAYVEGMLAAVTVGGSIVISAKKHTAQEHLLRMQKYAVNDIVCISSVMIRMMTAASEKSTAFPHMHAAYWAGACPAWVWEKARSIFQITDCGNGYGMTECGSTSHIMGPCDPKELVPVCHGRQKSAGAAAFPEGSGQILSVKILAEDGSRECLPGEEGEILLKGIAVTKGYYQDPEATAAVFDADGWLHSGDLGTMDEKGYLTFLGRKDDMYKVNGENVSPKFVENVLLQHKNIRYAEVVGISHDRCGQAGAAFVEFYEYREDAVSGLQEYIREKLARFQQPELVIPMKSSEWPKTATGKISKKELRTMAEHLQQQYRE